MPEFRVSWEIDVTADSEQEAAKIAQAIQRDPNSIATFFKVQEWSGRMFSAKVRIPSYKAPVLIELKEEE